MKQLNPSAFFIFFYLNSPYPSNQRGRRKYNSDDSLFLHFGTSKDILKKRKVV